MGGTKDFIKEGGFSETKYKQIGTTANGIKILQSKSGENRTPTFSNTPGITYAKQDQSGKVNQISAYGQAGNSRAKLKDIDIGHGHKNKDLRGHVIKRFKSDDIHVHEYRLDKNGIPRKILRARNPSKKERRLLMFARNGKR